MVLCYVCKNEYVVITPLHLRKHGLTIDSYLSEFSQAKIRDDYKCASCDILVDYGTSSKSIYCKQCSIDINEMNISKNIRKYNAKKKRIMNSIYSSANREYSTVLENMENNDTELRVDNTHSAWDFVPGMQNTLGTLSDADLSINKNGRIKAAVALKKKIENLRRGKRGKGRNRKKDNYK